MLYKKNNNILWDNDIAKEMQNVRFAFDVWEKGEFPPVGNQFIKCHMRFNVKMEDLRRKERMVAGSHMTNTSPTIMYANFVFCERVRIDLTMEELHDLSVKNADMMNAYIKESCGEKIYIILRPEFGPDEGKLNVIVQALSGLKSDGESFRNHLSNFMKHMGYKPCLAGHYLWIIPKTRNSDGLEYYKYILLYGMNRRKSSNRWINTSG